MGVPRSVPFRAMQPSHTALGTWSGGRFMHFGEALDDERLISLLRPGDGIDTVITADAYGAGWNATLSGAPAPIARVNLLARGLALPPGRHVVEMRYETPGMRTGVASTRIALAIAVLLAITSAMFALRERL